MTSTQVFHLNNVAMEYIYILLYIHLIFVHEVNILQIALSDCYLPSLLGVNTCMNKAQLTLETLPLAEINSEAQIG